MKTSKTILCKQKQLLLIRFAYNYNFMAEQRPSLRIDQVVECLLQQQKSITLAAETPENIVSIYQSTKALLVQFQEHISRCKKYNQAKIHRKYQILVNELFTYNQILKSKLGQELKARPSSQKYVSDLIDKMVEIRRKNQQLARENQALQNTILSYEENSRLLANGKAQRSNIYTDNKQILRKQAQKLVLKQSINRYLANKRSEDQKAEEKSNFQKFLLFNQTKLQKWNLLDFFQKIDRWSCNLRDIRFPERSKIKSSFQHYYQRVREFSRSPITKKTPNTANTLGLASKTKSFLEENFSKRTKMVDRIISKCKKPTTFRLKSLNQQENNIQTYTIQ